MNDPVDGNVYLHTQFEPFDAHRVFACFEKYRVPGLAQFDFAVAGNGTVNTVRLSGAFFGTPTGACLLDAAKDARFPRFSRERQQFVYPFFLRQ